MSSTTTSLSPNEVYKSKRVVQTVSHILTELVQDNKYQKVAKTVKEAQKKLPFYSKCAASVSLSEYLDRILRYTHIEESTLIIALIYIDRVCESHDLFLCEANIHR
jgi:hypothetical protein